MHENEYLSYEGTQELISYIKEDIAGAQSAPAGNPLTLTDCAPINVESLVVEFSPKQDLHGQSAPYVGGAGKNKLPMTVDVIKAMNTIGTWSGNTYSVVNMTFEIIEDNDGNVIGIKINGTSSSSTAFDLVNMQFSVGEYVLTDDGEVRNDIFTFVTEKGGTNNTSRENPFSITTSESRNVGIYISGSGVSATNVILKPMIRLSTETDATFAPYSNICPITGYTECEVDDVGKNLFDSDYLLNANGWAKDGEYYFGNTADLYNYFVANPYHVKTVPNTAYTFSIYAYVASGSVAILRIYYTDGTDTNIWFDNTTEQKISITSNPNKTIDCLQISWATSGIVHIRNAQFAEEQLSTTYEPYHSSNATIQFGQTVYGGRSNFTEGGTKEIKGYAKKDTPIADFSGTNPTYGKYVAYTIADCDNTQQDKVDYLCSNVPVTFDVSLTTTHRYGNTFFVYVPTTWSVSDYNSIIAPDLEFSYPLDTENTISTPHTDLKLLQGTNNITTNGTTINLGYQPDNALGQVLGEAYKYTDKKTAGGSGNYMEKGVDYVTAGQELGSILGDNATAEGYKTVAYGNNSHAEGYKTSAYGEDAHVEGRATTATNYTHAEGGYTYANGYCSHSEGFKTCSNGDYAHAEGYKTCAYGHWNGIHHAEGSKTYAAGTSSHAEGSGTTAWNASHAEGENTLAGWASDGNIAMATHAEGEETTAFKSWAHSEGYRSYANGLGAHAEGGYFLSPDFHNGGSALGNASHAEGCSTYAKGNVSHAEGQETTAYGHNSHAEGIQTSAKGIASHAEGYHTTAYGEDSHAEGSNTKASGDYSHAEGYHTTAYGEDSHAEGYYTKASAQYSHASGVCTSAGNLASCSIGHYNAAMAGGGAPNNTNGTAFAIGNGTGPTALSNAFSVQFNGTVAAAGAQVHPAADYAEFFEWIDGNPRDTDRVGYFVTIDKNDPTKITIAEPEDDYILGIVSGAPCVIGNGDCDVWNGMTIKDDFGRTVYIEPGVPKYNPNYDPTKPYVSRMDRKEWAAVGMLGVLPVHDDGTCQVGGFCTVGQRGYATKADNYDRNGNCYKVIERVSDKVVKVIFR